MKALLVFMLFVSIFINVVFYMREDNYKKSADFYRSENETNKIQLDFLYGFVSSDECNVDHQSTINYVKENQIEYKERRERNYIYLMLKYLTFRFSDDGALLSVVPDK